MIRTGRLLMALCVAAILSPAPALAQPAAPSATVQAPAAPTLEVLDRGQEPRRELRYTFVLDDRHEMTVTTKMSMQMRMQGMELPESPTPTSRVTLTLRVADLDAAGNATLDAEMGPMEFLPTPGVDAAMLEMIGEMATGTQGTTMRYRVGRDGAVSDLTLNAAEGMNPMLLQSLESMQDAMSTMSVRFPAEALGVGARWKTTTETTLGGVRMRSVMEHVIEGFEDGNPRLRTTVTQTADRQKVENDQLPPGATMELISMQTNATGSALVSLDFNRRSHATSDSKTEQVSEVTMAGQTQRFENVIQMRMEMSSGRAD